MTGKLPHAFRTAAYLSKKSDKGGHITFSAFQQEKGVDAPGYISEYLMVYENNKLQDSFRGTCKSRPLSQNEAMVYLRNQEQQYQENNLPLIDETSPVFKKILEHYDYFDMPHFLKLIDVYAENIAEAATKAPAQGNIKKPPLVKKR